VVIIGNKLQCALYHQRRSWCNPTSPQIKGILAPASRFYIFELMENHVRIKHSIHVQFLTLLQVELPRSSQSSAQWLGFSGSSSNAPWWGRTSQCGCHLGSTHRLWAGSPWLQHRSPRRPRCDTHGGPENMEHLAGGAHRFMAVAPWPCQLQNHRSGVVYHLKLALKSNCKDITGMRPAFLTCLCCKPWLAGLENIGYDAKERNPFSMIRCQNMAR